MVAHTPCRYANGVPQNGVGSKSCSQVIHNQRTLISFRRICPLDTRRTCLSGITSCVHLPGGRGRSGIAAAALFFINGKPFTIANLYLPASAVHSRSGNRCDVKLSKRPRFRRRNTGTRAFRNSTDTGSQPRLSHRWLDTTRTGCKPRSLSAPG